MSIRFLCWACIIGYLFIACAVGLDFPAGISIGNGAQNPSKINTESNQFTFDKDSDSPLSIPKIQSSSHQAATLTVCPMGCDYTDIQAAISAANPSDTIEIHGGYYDKVIITKSLTICGGHMEPGGAITKTGNEPPTIGTLYQCRHSLALDLRWLKVNENREDCPPGVVSEQGTSPETAYIGPMPSTSSNNKQLGQSTTVPKLSGTNAVTWNNQGLALYNQGKYDEAIKCYDKAIDLSPDLAGAWYNKGVALYKQGKYDEAIKCHDKAIEIDPQLADAWGNKGSALNSQGKYHEAIQACDMALRINPQYALAWNNKGIALYYLGKYDEAVKCYDKAIEIDPQYTLTWNNKGYALQALGHTTEAEAAFAKARELGYTG